MDVLFKGRYQPDALELWPSVQKYISVMLGVSRDELVFKFEENFSTGDACDIEVIVPRSIPASKVTNLNARMKELLTLGHKFNAHF